MKMYQAPEAQAIALLAKDAVASSANRDELPDDEW